jgi:two-component system chemotaxis response regulator CheY
MIQDIPSNRIYCLHRLDHFRAYHLSTIIITIGHYKNGFNFQILSQNLFRKWKLNKVYPKQYQMYSVDIMKLLIVDDAPSVLKALSDSLCAHGHEVYGAVNGEEAMKKYIELTPDIVLMDVLMPKLDGVRATRSLIERDPKAKIIVVTALGKRGLEKECIEAGASCFIMKPFKIKDLLNMINSLGKHERN